MSAIVWAPHPGSQFHFLTSPVYEALYEGSRGGGKTAGLLMDFAQFCGPQHGFGEAWRGILFRETYPQLADVVAKSRSIFYRAFPGVKFNAGDFVWTWPTGEQLYFRHMRKPDDYWSYHGHEYPWIGWEELTNWANGECYDSMKACSRSPFSGVPRRYRATANPYGIGHCVPYGEVMTPAGWRDIADIQVGDVVYSVDQSGSICEKAVDQTHAQRYVGKLVVRNGRGLHMAMTPDHKLPLVRGGGFVLTPFRKLPGQADVKRTARFDGRSLGNFSVPPMKTRKRKLSQPSSISALDYAELMGWFLSEGSVVDRDKAFDIAQTKRVNRGRIRALLTRCGFVQSWSATQVRIHAPDWWAYLRRFGKCRDKFVPTELKGASREELEAFADAAMAGDGHRHGSGGHYYTTSRRLADDMSEVFVKLGYAVHVSSRQRDGREGLSYDVSFSKRDTVQLITGNHVYKVESECRSVNVDEVEFDGPVYCIGVPDTHTFIIRQNGCVWLSGNSWVKSHFIDPAPPGIVIREPGKMERVRIRGYHFENTDLMTADPEYVTRLRSIINPNKRRAWLQASWDIVAGGIFDSVWRDEVHAIEPFKIPLAWRIDRSFDWGSSRPFSVGWWAMADGSQVQTGFDENGPVMRTFPRGTLFRIAEWYGWNGRPNEGSMMLASEIARGILKREEEMGIRGRVKPGPADSAIFDTQNGVCIADDMARIGVRWERADKSPGSRRNGWERMRDMFAAGLDFPMERPGLFVFNTCRQFLRTVPNLPRDERDPDDVPTNVEDHCLHGDTMIETAAGTMTLRDAAGSDGLVRTPVGVEPYRNARLTRRAAPTVLVVFSDGRSVRATPDHRFLTHEGWVEAQDMRGHTAIVDIATRGDTPVVCVQVHPQPPANVYCLTVPDAGVFYANGVAVSNCGDESRYRITMPARVTTERELNA